MTERRVVVVEMINAIANGEPDWGGILTGVDEAVDQLHPDVDITVTPDTELAQFLDDNLPESLKDNLTIIVHNDGEKTEIDLDRVLDCLPLAYSKPVEVTSYLLKVRQGICNMAYSMEVYCNQTEDLFRVWRAELGRTLNYTDDRNPLVADGSKTTNSAIESYQRSQPEYKEYKDKISQITATKQMLWSCKRTVDMALDVVSKIRTEALADGVSGVNIDQWGDDAVRRVIDQGRD